MIRTLVIAKDASSKAELRAALSHYSLAASFTSYANGFKEAIASEKPQVLLIETDESVPSPENWDFISSLKKQTDLPLIALVPKDNLGGMETGLNIDDFLVSPYDTSELVIRINRLLASRQPEFTEPIEGKGLVIDPDTCEVTVEGNRVELTFKEYELLKLLASNKGRVFTREALLNKIWGFDYYGGDRTVDVHIRRLRSKIELTQPYIETVRNIGYRFVRES